MVCLLSWFVLAWPGLLRPSTGIILYLIYPSMQLQRDFDILRFQTMHAEMCRFVADAKWGYIVAIVKRNLRPLRIAVGLRKLSVVVLGRKA